VSKNDLNQLENLDAIIINFGPINQEVLKFMESHQQDLYCPSIIFEAMGRGSFVLDERLLSVDRLFYSTGKWHVNTGK